MIVELKIALVSAVAWGVFALSQVIDGALSGVVLIGAALAALAIIGRSVRSAVLFLRRVSKGVDLLFELADWRQHVDKRLDVVEAKVDAQAADLTVKHAVGGAGIRSSGPMFTDPRTNP